MVKVISAEPIENHKLRVLLSNDKRGTFDVSPYLDRGIFHEFRDQQYFRRVRVAFGGSCGLMSRISVRKPLSMNCNKIERLTKQFRERLIAAAKFEPVGRISHFGII